MKISNTGYWSADFAHNHHVFCPELAYIISDELEQKIVVNDFGAGLGHYCQYLTERGFRCNAFDGDPSLKAVFPITAQDLTQPFVVLEKGNSLCLEVGEHIPANYTHELVANLVENTSNYLILSWAVPGQAGVGHVNCLTNKQVIEMMVGEGFQFDKWFTKYLQSQPYPSAPWFKNTLMAFHK